MRVAQHLGGISTPVSRRTVFRWIDQRQYVEWPVYNSTPLYDQTSLAGPGSDIRVVSETWFKHDAHDSIEHFVQSLPLKYVIFDAHDRYSNSMRYEIDTLFHIFLLKELHGWTSEAALIEYLECRPKLCDQLGLEAVLHQSTLWHSWHERFTTELRSTAETAAWAILVKAKNASLAVPRNPERHLPSHGDEEDESDPDNRSVLDEAATITDPGSRVGFPAVSLDRDEGCEIHENAYWDLQTYLGLREGLAANEGARNLVYESTRDRTPLGDAHRKHRPTDCSDGIRIGTRLTGNCISARTSGKRRR